MTLTDDQIAFLEECEQDFEDRYTDKDTEYIEIKNKPLSDPPIIDPWTGGQEQSYGNHRGGRGGRGGRNYHHQQQRHRSSYDNRDRRSYDNHRSSYDTSYDNRNNHQQRRYDDDRNSRGTRYQPY